MPGTLTVTVTCTKPAGTACTNYDTDAASGGTAIVKVTYLHPWVTPVGSMFGGKHDQPRQDQPDEDRMSTRQIRDRGEDGAVAVLVALLVVVLFTCAALAVDITQKSLTRQTLHDTLDTAAHAGAYALPGDGVGAKAAALAMAKANDPSVVPQVDLWCVVASTGVLKTVKATQIPSTCNPGRRRTTWPTTRACAATPSCVRSPASRRRATSATRCGPPTPRWCRSTSHPVIGVKQGDTGRGVVGRVQGLLRQRGAEPVGRGDRGRPHAQHGRP